MSWRTVPMTSRNGHVPLQASFSIEGVEILDWRAAHAKEQRRQVTHSVTNPVGFVQITMENMACSRMTMLAG